MSTPDSPEVLSAQLVIDLLAALGHHGKVTVELDFLDGDADGVADTTTGTIRISPGLDGDALLALLKEGMRALAQPPIRLMTLSGREQAGERARPDRRAPLRAVDDDPQGGSQ